MKFVALRSHSGLVCLAPRIKLERKLMRIGGRIEPPV